MSCSAYHSLGFIVQALGSTRRWVEFCPAAKPESRLAGLGLYMITAGCRFGYEGFSHQLCKQCRRQFVTFALLLCLLLCTGYCYRWQTVGARLTELGTLNLCHMLAVYVFESQRQAGWMFACRLHTTLDRSVCACGWTGFHPKGSKVGALRWAESE